MRQFNPQGFQVRPQQIELKQPWKLTVEKLASDISERFSKLGSKIDQLVTANNILEV